MEITSSAIILFCIFIVIVVYGHIRVRHIKQDEKKSFLKRNGKLAAIPFILIFMFNQPYVFPISWSEMQEESTILKKNNDPIKSDFDSKKSIETLRRDIIRLTKEVNEINEFYGLILRTALIGILVHLIFSVFTKEKD